MTFVEEFLEHVFDDFLSFRSLFLPACYDITSTRRFLQSRMHRNGSAKLQCLGVFEIIFVFRLWENFEKLVIIHFEQNLVCFAKGVCYIWFLFQRTSECPDGMTSSFRIIPSILLLRAEFSECIPRIMYYGIGKASQSKIIRGYSVYSYAGNRVNRTHP